MIMLKVSSRTKFHHALGREKGRGGGGGGLVELGDKFLNST